MVPVNQQSGGGQWGQIASSKNFLAGTGGSVVLSNGTGESKVVMADAVRFKYTRTLDITAPSIPTGLTTTGTSTSSVRHDTD